MTKGVWASLLSLSSTAPPLIPFFAALHATPQLHGRDLPVVGNLGSLRLACDPRRRERRRTKGAHRLGSRTRLHFPYVLTSSELPELPAKTSG